MNSVWRTTAILCVTLCLTVSSAIADDISLTVYNSDLGVVRELRSLSFQQGDGRIAFTDVASRIDPTSVSFELADPDKKVEILEQNYAFDLVSPDKIYSKYIDQEIEIVTEQGELFAGTLLSFSGGYLVIKAADGRIKSIVQEQVRDVTFPELPEGLITRPTLFWLYSSDFLGQTDAIVSYQTSGINWHAEYVGILSEDEKMLDLNGWVSVDNRSGKTYPEARLKVVAGDIHRVKPERRAYPEVDMMTAARAPVAKGFEEKPFFEYHLYTLPRKTTIADNEIKQISMFEPAVAQVEKELRYNAVPGNKTVYVYIKTRNSQEVGLGMPLPAGRVRVFKEDSDQSMILLGEDRIDHTPRNEEIKLTIGEAFDVVGETVTVSQRRVSDRVTDTDVRIEVRNQKDKPIRIVVSKKMYGFWDITSSSIDFVKKSATEVEWILDIAPEDKGEIDFTVRVTR